MGGANVPPSASLLLANGLMLLKVGAISPEFVDLVKEKYAAELFQNATVANINDWVARKTHGKIMAILDKAGTDASTAVILSAVYFKSRWAQPFPERLTKAESFKLSNSDQFQVAMMHRSGNYALIRRQNYRALRLPYIIPSLALVVVLPNETDGLADVIRSIDAREQTALLAAFRSTPPSSSVMLALPRFKIESDLDLIPPFQKAGMKLAFDNDHADFSGMTGSPASDSGLVIALIKHRAVIEVTEAATEAAAVSAVGPAVGTASPQPPEVFRVDHPFLFYLADNATGAILFAGRVSSPPQFAEPVAVQAPDPLPAITLDVQRALPAETRIPPPLAPVTVGPAAKR